LDTGKQGYPISKGASQASVTGGPSAGPYPPASAKDAGADRGRWVVRGLWLAVSCSLLGMAIFLPFGWDTKEYVRTLHGGSALAYSPLFLVPVVGVARLLPLWLTPTSRDG
jgi:hypothetical protein